MILKSAPAESIASNVDYSVVQHLQEKHYDAAAISAALAHGDRRPVWYHHMEHGPHGIFGDKYKAVVCCLLYPGFVKSKVAANGN